MTEVMDFFQPIVSFNNIAPTSISKAEAELAVSLKVEARRLAAEADEEMQNGHKTEQLAFEATESYKSRMFAEITLWHSSRAAEIYRKSARRFEEAGKLQIKKRRALTLMAKEMTRRAAEAEALIKLLNDFLKSN